MSKSIKRVKRGLAVLLSVSMVQGMTPLPAGAAGFTAEEAANTDIDFYSEDSDTGENDTDINFSSEDSDAGETDADSSSQAEDFTAGEYDTDTYSQAEDSDEAAQEQVDVLSGADWVAEDNVPSAGIVYEETKVVPYIDENGNSTSHLVEVVTDQYYSSTTEKWG